MVEGPVIWAFCINLAIQTLCLTLRPQWQPAVWRAKLVARLGQCQSLSFDSDLVCDRDFLCDGCIEIYVRLLCLDGND